jgi:hypothetical protein
MMPSPPLARAGRFCVAAALLEVMCLALSLRGAELAVGDTVPNFAAKDQQGKPFKFEGGRKFLLLGFERGATTAADEKLAALGAGWLEKHDAVYVMDIHPMPRIVRVFALPKLRKNPQRIVLVDDPNLLMSMPRKPGNITVLMLTPERKVTEIRYWNAASESPDKVLNDPAQNRN